MAAGELTCRYSVYLQFIACRKYGISGHAVLYAPKTPEEVAFNEAVLAVAIRLARLNDDLLESKHLVQSQEAEAKLDANIAVRRSWAQTCLSGMGVYPQLAQPVRVGRACLVCQTKEAGVIKIQVGQGGGITTDFFLCPRHVLHTKLLVTWASITMLAEGVVRVWVGRLDREKKDVEEAIGNLPAELEKHPELTQFRSDIRTCEAKLREIFSLDPHPKEPDGTDCEDIFKRIPAVTAAAAAAAAAQLTPQQQREAVAEEAADQLVLMR